MPHFGGNIVAGFSLPSFHKNFDVDGKTITQAELDKELEGKLHNLAQTIDK